MRSWRVLAVVSSIVVVGGCTSILGDFTVNANGSGGDGGGTDGGGDGAGTDGSSGDGGGTDAGDAGGDGSTRTDGGPRSCSLFTTGPGAPRKVMDYTDQNGVPATYSNDFLVRHMNNPQDPRVFALFQPQSSNGIQSVSFRTNHVETANMEVTPNGRPAFVDRSGSSVYVFSEERSGTAASVYAYKLDDSASGALQNGATRSPNPIFGYTSSSYNTHYAGRAIDQNGTFIGALAVQSSSVSTNFDLYFLQNFGYSSSIQLPAAFQSVYGGSGGNNFSLDGAGLFAAAGHYYLLSAITDQTSTVSNETEFEFAPGAVSPSQQRIVPSGPFFPILFSPAGSQALDVGVALPNADAGSGIFDVYFGRMPESSAMTFNPVSDPNFHKAPLFTDPDKSPLGQQMGCFATFPGTGIFVGRGQTPQSTGVNLYLFDLPTATTVFAAAGTGQNLLPGNTKFTRCAVDYAGTVLGGAQNWDLVWTQPADAQPGVPQHDEIWYATVYCN